MSKVPHFKVLYLFKVTLDLEKNLLVCLKGHIPKDSKGFSFYGDHTGKASDLYLSVNKRYLLKVQKCKYSFNNEFIKWTLRDLFKKFTILNLDARREFKGYKLVNRAGLKTPKMYCWGSSLSPLSSIVSFMIIEYKQDVVCGFSYFNSLQKSERINFITKLSYEASMLAQQGYIHRDFHLSNFLVDDLGEIFWIDVHLRKLSTNKKKRREQIVNSLASHHLGGARYKEIVYNILISTK